MILEPVAPFRGRDVAFKIARDPWESAGYFRLRRRVFCDEQGLFDDDRDALDERAIPLVALTRVAGVLEDVVGVVRIWEEERGFWWGGRLATDRDHRRSIAIGSGLVRLAVTTAIARGCARFRATVQTQNVGLFEDLGWAVIGDATVCGRPHAVMDADLASYGRIGS